MSTALPVELIFLNGQAVAVDTTRVDAAIKRLWVEGRQTIERMTRACVLTLVVVTREPAGADQARATLPHVMTTHPGRAIILQSDEWAEPSELRAWLSAQCQAPRAGGQRVCCEVVTLEADGEATELLPSVVLPLLVPDLPVVLWWPGDPPFGAPVFEQLAEAADRLIIDTVSFEDVSLSLARLTALVQARSGRLAVTDLNWARLAPWQAQIAQVFDSDATLPYLERLERLAVRFARLPGSGPVDPEQSLLLVGWLLNRIGWKQPPALARVGAGHFRGRLRRAGRDLMVEVAPQDVEPTAEAPLPSGSLVSVELRAGGAGQGAAFHLERDLNAPDCVETTIALAGRDPFTSTRILPRRDIAGLLAEALAQHDHDYLFEAALAAAAHLSGAA